MWTLTWNLKYFPSLSTGGKAKGGEIIYSLQTSLKVSAYTFSPHEFSRSNLTSLFHWNLSMKAFSRIPASLLGKCYQLYQDKLLRLLTLTWTWINDEKQWGTEAQNLMCKLFKPSVILIDPSPRKVRYSWVMLLVATLCLSLFMWVYFQTETIHKELRRLFKNYYYF